MPLTKEEIQRKILHFIFGTIIPVGIFYIPRYTPRLTWLPQLIPNWSYPTIILALFLVWFVGLEFFRFRVPAVQKLFTKSFGHMLRKEEDRKITGATWINASALICSIVFRNYPHISFIVLAIFIWGDAAAALVGISIGRIKIRKKTLEGSLACLATCLILCFGVFPFVPSLLDVWEGRMPVLIGVVACVLVTVLELFPFEFSEKFTINDNLAVPVITGAVMVLMSRGI